MQERDRSALPLLRPAPLTHLTMASRPSKRARPQPTSEPSSKKSHAPGADLNNAPRPSRPATSVAKREIGFWKHQMKARPGTRQCRAPSNAKNVLPATILERVAAEWRPQVPFRCACHRLVVGLFYQWTTTECGLHFAAQRGTCRHCRQFRLKLNSRQIWTKCFGATMLQTLPAPNATQGWIVVGRLSCRTPVRRARGRQNLTNMVLNRPEISTLV